MGTANAQGEKYLTDVIGILRTAGEVVAASNAPAAQDALGDASFALRADCVINATGV